MRAAWRLLLSIFGPVVSYSPPFAGLTMPQVAGVIRPGIGREAHTRAHMLDKSIELGSRWRRKKRRVLSTRKWGPTTKQSTALTNGSLNLGCACTPLCTLEGTPQSPAPTFPCLQSYTGYEPTSMRAIRARYDPYVQVGAVHCSCLQTLPSLCLPHTAVPSSRELCKLLCLTHPD